MEDAIYTLLSYPDGPICLSLAVADSSWHTSGVLSQNLSGSLEDSWLLAFSEAAAWRETQPQGIKTQFLTNRAWGPVDKCSHVPSFGGTILQGILHGSSDAQ